ncbi:MAG: DUF1848 family protein [Candidatus Methanoperedens sp.]|nr:DUF1848 family protein [Candidatus Methanoperedens sp.]
MTNKIKIGITERGDAGTDFSWIEKAKQLNTQGLILVSKRMSRRLTEEARKTNSIIHATITGHGGSLIEPNVLTPEESYLLFSHAIKKLGKERVVLRIDPILPTEEGIKAALGVYEALKHHGTRIRISFLDNYPHVRARFQAAGLQPLPYRFHAPLEQRKKTAALFSGAEICGEPGFECTGCVSALDLHTLGINIENLQRGNQRRDCTCLTIKTELLQRKGQCLHGCLYCYWR